MKYCELCNNETLEEATFCKICGFNSKANTFENPDRLRLYYKSLCSKDHYHWSKRLYLIERIMELLRYEQCDVVKLLSISKSNVSQCLTLLSHLKENHELEDFESMTSAFNAAKGTLKPVDYEKDLQKYIYREWENTVFAEEWYIYNKNHLFGKFKAGEAGEIDLLAHHRRKNKWLIIELKREKSSDRTVGQTLRYMGWVKDNLAEQDDEVNGIIISRTYDKNIELSLKCIPSIKLYIYNRLDHNLLQFIPPEEAEIFEAKQLLSRLSSEQIESLKKRFSR